LRPLDTGGHEIVSQLNYHLKRAPTHTLVETGGEETANASPEYSDWKLILLGESGVDVAAPRRPHFVLDSTKKRSGFGGCSQLVGNYTLDGDHLSFRQIAGTIMACLESMEMEKAFLQILPRVNSWKINGQRRDLLDTSGKRIAGFEARNMK